MSQPHCTVHTVYTISIHSSLRVCTHYSPPLNSMNYKINYTYHSHSRLRAEPCQSNVITIYIDLLKRKGTQYNVITIYIGLLQCTGPLFTHIVHFIHKHNIYRSLKVQVHRSLTLYYVNTIHTGILKCTDTQFTYKYTSI